MKILWCPVCWQLVDSPAPYKLDEMHNTPDGDCYGDWLPVAVERAKVLMSTNEGRITAPMEVDGPWVLERVAAGMINEREWPFHQSIERTGRAS